MEDDEEKNKKIENPNKKSKIKSMITVIGRFLKKFKYIIIILFLILFVALGLKYSYNFTSETDTLNLKMLEN